MPELALSQQSGTMNLATWVHWVQPDWARISKCLRSPGIDSKESIPPGYVCWRHRFLDNYKFGLWAHTTIMTEETVVDTTCENLWWQCPDGQSPCRSQKRRVECTLWPRPQRLGCHLGSRSYLHIAQQTVKNVSYGRSGSGAKVGWWSRGSIMSIYVQHL